MKKLLTLGLLFLILFSGKSQENFCSIDMMLLEKAPLTCHKHMNDLLVSATANSTVIKKTNAASGDTFFMYYQDKLFQRYFGSFCTNTK